MAVSKGEQAYDVSGAAFGRRACCRTILPLCHVMQLYLEGATVGWICEAIETGETPLG